MASVRVAVARRRNWVRRMVMKSVEKFCSGCRSVKIRNGRLYKKFNQRKERKHSAAVVMSVEDDAEMS